MWSVFCKEIIINILQRKVVFCTVLYHRKYSHIQKREYLDNSNILQNIPLCAKAITHRYLLLLSFTWQAVDHPHILGICALQVMPYKHVIMTCAMIVPVSDEWGFQIKVYITIFSNCCDTIYLLGKQNHLKQEKDTVMLKLFCVFLRACNKGKFDQTKALLWQSS